MGPCILLRFSLDKNDMLLTKRRNSSGPVEKTSPKDWKIFQKKSLPIIDDHRKTMITKEFSVLEHH